jgi:hypothetical protein
LAELSAGSRSAAKIAIMAITTRSSISVNPLVACAAVRVGVRISFSLTVYYLFNTAYSITVYTKKPPAETGGQKHRFL